MDREEVLRAIAARPELDLRVASPMACYEALLAAQERGVPGSVRVALLVEFMDATDALEAEMRDLHDL